MMTSPPTIGFIGLGLMGRPMALNLRKAGFALVVHSRSRGPVEALVQEGAVAASSPRAVAEAAQVVITMLPDTPDVVQVIEGAEGVLAGLQPGTVVIDMSSISPEETRRLAARVETHGGTMLDAPVSGGEIGARSGTLSIMVGGDAAVVERVRPILEAMGAADRIIHVGPSAAGQVCKICNQIAIGGALVGVSEAFAIARSAGVDASRVRQALLGGFASSRVLDVHGGRLLEGQFEPGFRTALYQKDLRLAVEAATSLAVSVPTTQVVADLVDRLVAGGGSHLDYAAVGTAAGGRLDVVVREMPEIEIDTVSCDDARHAFRWAQPLPMRQAWRTASESGFRPAVVRVGWHVNHVLVLAEMDDEDVVSSATGHGQRFWELGDTFEMFLAPEGGTHYIECHVTPDNHRLQLRFPMEGPRVLGADPFTAALVPGDDVRSRVWRRQDRPGWVVLASVPVTLAGVSPSSLGGGVWRFSFCRYDGATTASEPVISSTSPHPVPAFHRPHEWGTLRFRAN